MKNKKIYLVSGLTLLGLGLSGCQNMSISSSYSRPSLLIKSSKNSSFTESSSSQENTSEYFRKKSTVRLPGDEGPYPIPVQYQGTWYSYVEDKEEEITFTSSRIIVDSDSIELRKVDVDKLPAAPSQKQIAKGAHYGRALPVTIDGINYLNIKSYFQVSGTGTYYGYYFKKGYPIIILSFGENASGNNLIYWKTPNLAKQYKDEKFNDFHYRERKNED